MVDPASSRAAPVAGGAIAKVGAEDAEVADEADDTRAAAAADHLRAGELKELLTKAGAEFG